MGDSEPALHPPAFGKSGFLARLRGIGKEDLAGDGKDPFVRESIEQRLQEPGVDSHVAVQEDDYVILCSREARIGTAAEAEIRRPDHLVDGSKSSSGRLPFLSCLQDTVIAHSQSSARTVVSDLIKL